MRTKSKSKSTSTAAPSTKVAKADAAKAAKAAPAKQYQGPLLEKPTAALEIRSDITPEIVAAIAAEAKATIYDDVEPGMPFSIFVAEAIDCALMVQKYWKSPNPDKYRPLSLYAYRLGETMAAEIVHLVDLAEVARDGAKMTTNAVDDRQLERARFVNRELRLAVEFDADDGVRNEKDDSVEALKRSHETEPATIAALADSLGAYARHAKKYEASLAQSPDFDGALIEEGELLSDALRARRKATGSSNDALESRDVYLQLLRNRLGKVRKVVRHAYRSTPEVIREATSAFHRERRRADRKPDPLEGDEPLPTPADGEGNGDDE